MHTKRESKFELLRIYSMLFYSLSQGIYLRNEETGHVIAETFGGFYVTATGWNLYLGAIFGQVLSIGVNTFLILGVWFMVDVKLSSQRIVKLKNCEIKA